MRIVWLIALTCALYAPNYLRMALDITIDRIDSTLLVVGVEWRRYAGIKGHFNVEPARQLSDRRSCAECRPRNDPRLAFVIDDRQAVRWEMLK